jgi:Protein of unknown function (DUF1350)
MDWQDIAGNSVLIPSRPKGIVHFLGGAFVAAAPQVTYRMLLEDLSRRGYLIIATPFVNTLDHVEIARSVLHSFEQALDRLYATRTLRSGYLPIYGVGHSMGCKLHLLICSLFSVKRSGNILISFNNFPARRSIPFLEQLSQLVEVEFTPTPTETRDIVEQNYSVRRNLLIRFKNDELDQSSMLVDILQSRFPGMVALRVLNGNHTTPIAQDINWRAGQSFTPFDAMGQWMRQQVYQDLDRLKQEISLWLNPMS